MNPVLTPRRLRADSPDFAGALDDLLRWDAVTEIPVEDTVAEIIDAVARNGDAALLDCTRRFDRWQPETAAHLEVPRARWEAALDSLRPELREALVLSARRIRDYHEQQKQDSWRISEADGSELGQLVRPLASAGLYVPGGKAAYPSTVLMTAIPAKVAGVEALVMVTPTVGGELNEVVLAAAAIAGVDRLFRIGGAQAIAALALGTATVPRVDKIVGPGNVYVAAAKRQVAGRVAIDMEAGPSEILVICDGGTPPDWIAMDLFSQAEHDENAQAILVCPDRAFLDAVEQSMQRLLPELERRDIIAASINRRGALIEVADLAEAVAVSNRVAPEHLELSVEDADALLDGIRHAGAIFMGRHTPEALGDYTAGPSHVLPTSGTARFSSPLGVYDFQKRSSLIRCAPGARAVQRSASILARSEALTAHARSAELRLEAEDG